MEPTVRSQTPFSRALRRLDHLVAHAAAAGVVGAVVAVFVVALAIAGFPEAWEVAFSTLAAAVTLVMVFVLHHTQRREQVATQLKLDELIRALPQADDHYVRVQAAGDDEVQELEERHMEHHRATRSG
ncbi:MAG TPA: low affinity iron permease family protein [Acidimicrobiia bacterium]